MPLITAEERRRVLALWAEWDRMPGYDLSASRFVDALADLAGKLGTTGSLVRDRLNYHVTRGRSRTVALDATIDDLSSPGRPQVVQTDRL